MSPTVIVLGYRQGLAAAVRRRGFEPFHIVEKDKPGLAGAPRTVVSKLEDAQEVLRAVMGALRHGAMRRTDVAGVVTAHEQGVFASALLRHFLGLPGDRNYGGTLLFRDKYLQKSNLPLDVPRARCEYIAAGSSFSDVAARLGAPFITKPANGRGATRTAAVDAPGDFDEILAALPPSAIGLVAESFVPGGEVHVDGIWSAGRIAWLSIGRYHQSPMSWNDGGTLASHLLPEAHHAALYQSARRLTAAVLGHLAAPDTVFHLECFEEAGRLVFGECAIRLAGAHIPEIIALTYGVNLYDDVVRLALGEPVVMQPSPPAPDRVHGFVYLRRHPGVTLEQRDFERCFPLVEIDFSPHGAPGSFGRCGHAIVADRCDQRLAELIDAIVTFSEAGRG